jgi:putative inorganic carbon (HCO3(-)) transporter
MHNNWLIPVPPVQESTSRPSKRREWSSFLASKLLSPLGYVIMFLVCAAIGIGVANYGLVFGAGFLALCFGIPFVYAAVAYPRFGITAFISMGYLIMWFYRMDLNFPLGTLMDAMDALLLLGMFIQLKRNKDAHILKGPVTTIIGIWIGYNLLEVANPSAESRLAWVYTVRTVALIMVIFFIFIYNIRTKAFIRFIIKLWLGFAFFAAAYAFKQQYFGFFPFEERYLNSDPVIFRLLFIGGSWRKFSIFSDPVVFAYTMAFSTILCVGLMTGPFSKTKKRMLFLLASFYVTTMLYSGTRGAYVLIPVAMMFYTILKFNRKILLLVSISAVILVALIFVPTSNGTLFRFQSAFKPSKDASYIVRKNNQKLIQPYILSHPMGGGMGATGTWGSRFSPGSYLASFPPDSGYIRVAVEMGWIGLFLMLLLVFTGLKTGINNYYSIRDPELKAYCFAMVLVLFAFHIANFPQEALVQYPSNINFYLVLALIVVTKRIDNEQNLLNES